MKAVKLGGEVRGICQYGLYQIWQGISGLSINLDSTIGEKVQENESLIAHLTHNHLNKQQLSWSFP